ncbi:TonB-dependent receptor domain-containing protein [Algicola sagamiensis]|uniref:TonB-dependent receptor domain-containing protein n=1 Tax=Algicola sagamiensis TaxID=163869 RepID=UPI000376A722|nr:TonB-dependent receptor [Algicola sagamiensis]
MFKLNPISNSVKLLALSVAAVSTLPNTAFAQESEADADVERIQVTGTRILREGVVAPAPITVLGEDTIKASGATNLGELLNSLPALGNTYSMSSSTSYIGTVGGSFLDLRRLGADRTLVLVDGKRHVASSAGSARVDINTIPTEWIKSVEVITGGASAVYGADAVTGVVNFILKETIEGVHFTAQKSKADDSGFSDYKYAFSAGGEFDNGKGNAAISLEVAGQNSITQADRGISQYATLDNPENNEPEAGMHDGNPDRIRVGNAGLHLYSPNGRFVIGDTPYIFLEDGTFRKQNLGTLSDDYYCVGNCDREDGSQESEYQPKYKRITFNSKLNYELHENVLLYFQGKYSKTDGFRRGTSSFTSAQEISIDNAFMNADLVELMAQNGIDTITVKRSHTDMGLRSEENVAQTTRFVSGLKGALFEDWDYDVSAVWGQTTSARKNYNNLIKARYANAVDAVIDPNTGRAVCRQSLDPKQASNPNVKNCVAANVMGNGRLSQDSRDWFMTTSLFEGKTTQTVYSASVANGALFELPAGDVGFAVGAEYRKETASSGYDDRVATGETFLTAIAPLSGQFDVTEAFTEFSIPVLADLPGVDLMTLDLAARYSDYSTIGSATTWKAGIDWAIYEDLRARYTLAKAVRAPNIDELYSPLGGNFAWVKDPCDKRYIANGTNLDLRKANCQALGVPADYQDSRSGNIPYKSGGNPNVGAETSTSTTIGFVYTPSFLDGFSTTVDYWYFEIDDVISSVTVEKLAQYCVDSPSGIQNKYCSQITRDASSGMITSAVSRVQNLAKKEAEGIDFEFAYQFEAFSGEVNTRFLGTYLMERADYPFQEDLSEKDQKISELGDPRWQGSLKTSYMVEDLTVNWNIQYVGGQYTNDREALSANPDAISPHKVGSVAYHDVQVRYQFTDEFETYVGIDNLLDKDAPWGLNGAGVDNAIYDNIGRKFYAGLSYSF